MCKKEFPNSVIKEFKTVELLINSTLPTGRTDAFIIAWVKSERQVRKIFSFIVFQIPVFDKKDVTSIIEAIADRSDLYFDDFITGFDRLYPKTYQDIVGEDSYQHSRDELRRINRIRNKILHGQPTGQSLSAEALRNEIRIIRKWCFEVANNMQNEIGYDGFGRNSFRKSNNKEMALNYKKQITSIDEFVNYLSELKK